MATTAAASNSNKHQQIAITFNLILLLVLLFFYQDLSTTHCRHSFSFHSKFNSIIDIVFDFYTNRTENRQICCFRC